ncbi:MAG TPA: glycosyl transferase family 36 [Armatimonadota bacterium]|nr:glycosyl transferase family 36 [Armatimonadota bacterium]
MSYGYFSEDGREYVITRPDTPRPWINYLSNGRYCALCSQTGGGHSFYETSGYNRITREYPPLVVHMDRPGRYIYLRDRDSGDYWSATWQPVCKDGDRFEARHGVGYTTVEFSYNGIDSKTTYYVPPRDDVEVWMVSLRNNSSQHRRLQVFPFVDWDLANYAYNLAEAQFSRLFNESSYEDGIIFVSSRFWNITSPGAGNPNTRWDKFAFMTTSLEPDGFDCFHESFIGMYNDWQHPRAVKEGKCLDSQGNGQQVIGAFQHDIELAPGQELRFVVIVGVVYRKEEARILKGRYDSWQEAERALAEVSIYWDNYLTRTTCETPDRDFDLSFNIWNKYQAWVTSRWSRMDSYYVGGGSIIGFRDSWQDMLGVLPNDLEWARQRVIYMLEHQFSDGSTLHNWDPLTNIGTKTGHSDDPMWLVLGVVEYLKESGDLVFLDEAVRYYDTGAETVRQHVLRALDYTLAHMSDRGIPLIMAADWNDGLDYVGRQGRGETTMVAAHLAWMLREVSLLLWFTGSDAIALKYSEAREKLIRAINEHLWDGDWYIRGTRDDGEAFGSSRNIEGRIYLNAQSWPVMAGATPRNRGIRAMDSVKKHLDTDFGPALFLPAYTEPDPKLGIISRFAPGTKENGTVFCHPVAWAIMAECVLGRGDRAYEIWKMTSFTKRGKQADVYKAEPYVYAEYIHGPDSATYGQGEFSWLTGTAAWMWKVSIDWILGVRAELRGLLVDPCIPSEWDGFKVVRRYRRATYEIDVVNPEHVSRGIAEITVDGDKWESHLLPVFSDGKTHKVHVTMGTPTEEIEVPTELISQRAGE